MAVKKAGRSNSEMPKFCIRRTQLPHMAEEYSIYPNGVGAFCASCYVKYLDDTIDVDIVGRSVSGGRWFFHSLSEKQKNQFLQALLKETGLNFAPDKPVMVNIDDISYSFDPPDGPTKGTDAGTTDIVNPQRVRKRRADIGVGMKTTMES